MKSGWKPAPSSSKDVTFPSNSIVPSLGKIIRVINFNKVDLPDPLVPINATVSPFFILIFIFFNT